MKLPFCERCDDKTGHINRLETLLIEARWTAEKLQRRVAKLEKAIVRWDAAISSCIECLDRKINRTTANEIYTLAQSIQKRKKGGA